MFDDKFAYHNEIRIVAEKLASEIFSNEMNGLQRVHNDPALEDAVKEISKKYGRSKEQTRRLLKEKRSQHYKTLEHLSEIL